MLLYVPSNLVLSYCIENVPAVHQLLVYQKLFVRWTQSTLNRRLLDREPVVRVSHPTDCPYKLTIQSVLTELVHGTRGARYLIGYYRAVYQLLHGFKNNSNFGQKMFTSTKFRSKLVKTYYFKFVKLEVSRVLG
jgi:hypothetical protein